MRPVEAAVAAAVALAALAAMPATAAGNLDHVLKRVQLPPGFEINLFARVPRARSMAVGGPLGTIFVGSRHGTVHILLDGDKDGVADEIVRKTGKLRVPNGVAFDGRFLYIAEQHRIVRWAPPSELDSTLPFDPRLKPIMTGLPDKFMHGWRYAAFGPDGKLYVSVGAPCNVCMPRGHEGKIIRMESDGNNIEVVARGVRNSVGFDWHPKTGEMFFTDNGSDGLGDDIPADELNHVTRIGQHFGYPWFGGGSTRTPEFKGQTPPKDNVKPVIEFQAHSANLGIHFYRGRMFPAEYRGDALVAQHGSWNRSSRVGYQVMRIRFDDKGSPVGKEVFTAGWLEGEHAWGRPVNIQELADGSLLVSDDFVGAIYRISYRGG